MGRLFSLRSLRERGSPLRGGERKRISVEGNAGKKNQDPSPFNSREPSTEVKDDSSFRENYSLTRKVLAYSLIIFLNEHRSVEGATPMEPEARAKRLCERYCTFGLSVPVLFYLTHFFLWGVVFQPTRKLPRRAFKCTGVFLSAGRNLSPPTLRATFRPC